MQNTTGSKTRNYDELIKEREGISHDKHIVGAKTTTSEPNVKTCRDTDKLYNPAYKYILEQ